MVIEEWPPLEEEKTEAGDQDLRRETRKNLAWILGVLFCIFDLVFWILDFSGETCELFYFGFMTRGETCENFAF